jgi:hypothetical protein
VSRVRRGVERAGILYKRRLRRGSSPRGLRHVAPLLDRPAALPQSRSSRPGLRPSGRARRLGRQASSRSPSSPSGPPPWVPPSHGVSAGPSTRGGLILGIGLGATHRESRLRRTGAVSRNQVVAHGSAGDSEVMPGKSAQILLVDIFGFSSGEAPAGRSHPPPWGGSPVFHRRLYIVSHSLMITHSLHPWRDPFGAA